MKQLSCWASQNIRRARWLIVGCYIAANLLGNVWALWLYVSGYTVNSTLTELAVLTTIAALLLHPKKGRTKANGYSYAWHKGCDLVLCLATVFFIASGTAGMMNATEPAQASFIPKQKEAAHSESAQTGRHSGVVTRLGQLKRWYSELPDWEKALLVTLVILGTVGLGIVWAGICCGIACNGAEALAAVLLILGLGGLITGCIFLCIRIIRGPRFRGPRELKKK